MLPTQKDLESHRKWAVKYACSFLLTPYIWSGDDFSGMDCSGFVREILLSVGQEDDEDKTAHGLYLKFKADSKLIDYEEIRPGCLIFFMKSGSATHVEIIIDSSGLSIGASGGGRPRFNLFAEIKKDPILSNFYGHLTEDEFKRRGNDLFLRIAKQLLFEKQAIDQNAFIKIRPIWTRLASAKFADPFKAPNGGGENGGRIITHP